MPEPEEVRFACIGCGALNAAGAEVCSGCGHRFAGPDLMPKVPLWVPPRRSEDYYEAPTSPIAPPRTFRIGTALVIIALIALALAALRLDIILGIGAIVWLAPASIRTLLVTGRWRAEGRPMGFGEQLQSFAMTMVATAAILISSAIAFFATCLPVGLMSGGLNGYFILGSAVGTVAAIACAVWLTRVFAKIGREQSSIDRPNRYR